jgi:hypothetical protein
MDNQIKVGDKVKVYRIRTKYLKDVAIGVYTVTSVSKTRITLEDTKFNQFMIHSQKEIKKTYGGSQHRYERITEEITVTITLTLEEIQAIKTCSLVLADYNEESNPENLDSAVGAESVIDRLSEKIDKIVTNK